MLSALGKDQVLRVTERVFQVVADLEKYFSFVARRQILSYLSVDLSASSGLACLLHSTLTNRNNARRLSDTELPQSSLKNTIFNRPHLQSKNL
jgi:hypothetical protein